MIFHFKLQPCFCRLKYIFFAVVGLFNKYTLIWVSVINASAPMREHTPKTNTHEMDEQKLNISTKWWWAFSHLVCTYCKFVTLQLNHIHKNKKKHTLIKSMKAAQELLSMASMWDRGKRVKKYDTEWVYTRNCRICFYSLFCRWEHYLFIKFCTRCTTAQDCGNYH